jgi:hypothetical protein
LNELLEAALQVNFKINLVNASLGTRVIFCGDPLAILNRDIGQAVNREAAPVVGRARGDVWVTTALAAELIEQSLFLAIFLADHMRAHFPDEILVSGYDDLLFCDCIADKVVRVAAHAPTLLVNRCNKNGLISVKKGLPTAILSVKISLSVPTDVEFNLSFRTHE